jgi:hypothetical protein
MFFRCAPDSRHSLAGLARQRSARSGCEHVQQGSCKTGVYSITSSAHAAQRRLNALGGTRSLPNQATEPLGRSEGFCFSTAQCIRPADIRPTESRGQLVIRCGCGELPHSRIPSEKQSTGDSWRPLDLAGSRAYVPQQAKPAGVDRLARLRVSGTSRRVSDFLCAAALTWPKHVRQ